MGRGNDRQEVTTVWDRKPCCLLTHAPPHSLLVFNYPKGVSFVIPILNNLFSSLIIYPLQSFLPMLKSLQQSPHLCTWESSKKRQFSMQWAKSLYLNQPLLTRIASVTWHELHINSSLRDKWAIARYVAHQLSVIWRQMSCESKTKNYDRVWKGSGLQAPSLPLQCFRWACVTFPGAARYRKITF